MTPLVNIFTIPLLLCHDRNALERGSEPLITPPGTVSKTAMWAHGRPLVCVSIVCFTAKDCVKRGGKIN